MSSLTVQIEGEVSAVITVTELDGNTAFDIAQTRDGGSIGDLRPLPFDVANETLLDGLSITGADVTDSAFEANSTANLGQGANINGQVIKERGRFDADVAFSHDIPSSQIVLSHDNLDVTIGLLNLKRAAVLEDWRFSRQLDLCPGSRRRTLIVP